MDQPFQDYQGDEPYNFLSYSHKDASGVFPDLTILKDQCAEPRNSRERDT